MNSLEVPNELKWWQSRVIMGALISAVLKVLAGIGLVFEFTDDQTQAIVTLALLVASLIGDRMSFKARMVQEYAPPIASRSMPGGMARSPAIAGLAALALAFATLSACAPRAPVSSGDIVAEQPALPAVVEKIYAGWRTGLSVALATGLLDVGLEARLIEYDVLIRGAYEAARLAAGEGDLAGVTAATIALEQMIGRAGALFKSRG